MEKMKIGVYGCSWTAGISLGGKNSYASWAYELAELNPDYEIHQYAQGGLGNDAMLYMFEKTKTMYDYTIVKLTSPTRQSFINHALVPRVGKTDKPNFYDLTSDSRDKIVTYNLGGKILHNLKSEIWNTALLRSGYKNYIKHYNWDFKVIIEQKLAEYLNQSADLCFCHTVNDKECYNVLCTEENISNFKSHIFDKGYHLTHDGAKLEAKWIDKIIKSR